MPTSNDKENGDHTRGDAKSPPPTSPQISESPLSPSRRKSLFTAHSLNRLPSFKGLASLPLSLPRTKSFLNMFRRKDAGRKNEIESDFETAPQGIGPQENFIVGNPALNHSGIPDRVADVIQELQKSFGFFITIRASVLGVPPKQRYQDGYISLKGTGLHTKTEKGDNPNRGHLPRRPEKYGEKYKDLTDHLHTDFPDGTTPFSRTKVDEYAAKIGPMNQTFGEKLIGITEWEGRLCVAIQRNAYRFAEDDEIEAITEMAKFTYQEGVNRTITYVDGYTVDYLCYGGKIYAQDEGTTIDHYMQETESLRSIASNILQGKYLLIKLEGDLLQYQTADHKHSYLIELDKLRDLPTSEENNLWVAANKEEFEWPKNLDPKLAALKKFLSSNKDKIDQVAPVWDINDDRTITANLVVSEPYPVTNDLDVMHFILPKNLPAEAFDIYDGFSLEGLTNLKIHALALLFELKDSSNTQLQNLYKTLGAFDPPGNSKGTRLIDRLLEELAPEPDLGSLSVGEFLYMCLLNHKVGMRPFRHGPESRNPAMGQTKPENFGGLTHFVRIDSERGAERMVIHTNNEETAALLYMQDTNRMQTHYLEVNPYWLINRSDADQSIVNLWLDVIRLQALYGMSQQIEKSFANMAKIDSSDRAGYNSFFEKQIKPLLSEYGSLTKNEKQKQINAIQERNKEKLGKFTQELNDKIQVKTKKGTKPS